MLCSGSAARPKTSGSTPRATTAESGPRVHRRASGADGANQSRFPELKTVSRNKQEPVKPPLKPPVKPVPLESSNQIKVTRKRPDPAPLQQESWFPEQQTPPEGSSSVSDKVSNKVMPSPPECREHPGLQGSGDVAALAEYTAAATKIQKTIARGRQGRQIAKRKGKSKNKDTTSEYCRKARETKERKKKEKARLLAEKEEKENQARVDEMVQSRIDAAVKNQTKIEDEIRESLRTSQ